MKKLIQGIVDFRQNVRPGVKDTFAKLALGQRPDTLFIACSDSRVVPNLFASSDPGDLFVVRNVGNLIPPCGLGHSPDEASEAAAIEFGLGSLPITDIIVCGHSECGAMHALAGGSVPMGSPFLLSWLRHGEPSLQRLDSGVLQHDHLERHNRLSQVNVLQQIEHLKTYPIVAKGLEAGRLHLHGWWFDIKEADVYEYSPAEARFRVIDEDYARILLERAGSAGAAGA